MSKLLAILAALAELLNRITVIFQQRQRKRTSQEYQEKANAAKADIVGTLNAHFGGVRDNTDPAGETDQAGDHSDKS